MYQRYNYPDAETLNPKLYKALPIWESKPVVGGGRKSNLDIHRQGIEEVDTILKWIGSLVPLVSHKYSNPSNIEFDYRDYLPPSDHGGGKYNFNIDAFNLSQCWSVLYNKGDGVEKHNHFPYALSFCYYVSMPDGSSPLILEDEVIHPKEGEVIFFLGSAYHSVPSCDVDGRCAMVGNIRYLDIYI